MATKNISISEETLARVKKLDREQMPSFSRLVEELLVRELDRIEQGRPQRRPRRQTSTT